MHAGGVGTGDSGFDKKDLLEVLKFPLAEDT